MCDLSVVKEFLTYCNETMRFKTPFFAIDMSRSNLFLKLLEGHTISDLSLLVKFTMLFNLSEVLSRPKYFGRQCDINDMQL
jgi:hypothetical protein